MEPYVQSISTTLDQEQTAPPVGAQVSEAARASGPDFSLNRLFYSSDSTRPKLRIGVMIDRADTQWLIIRKILEDIDQCDFAGIECLIVNCEPPKQREERRPPLPIRIARHLFDSRKRDRVLYYAYLRLLDDKHRVLPDPHAHIPCEDLLAGIERIDVVPLRKGAVHRFAPEDVERVRELDLDVILRFGFNILRGEILSAARQGIWSYHHGDSERYRGGPAQMWEMIEANPLSGAVLQRLDDTLDAGPVLHKAILSTCPRPWLSMHRYNVHWATQHFVIQKLYELHRYGAEHIEQRTRRCAGYDGKRKPYRKPSNLDMARWFVPFALKTLSRKIARRAEAFHWRIAVRRAARPLYEAPDSVCASDFTWIESPRAHFWADPFLIEEKGDIWLFFEDFDRAKKAGVISCGRLVDGKLVDVRTALSRPHHISYPYVFKHAGEVWMVPESEQAGRVQLYRAKRFPDEWVLEQTLLDLRAVDSSLFHHDGRWWMFTSPLVVVGHAPTTLLFVAPEPWGPWQLHRSGCICSDVRWARGAGSIIVQGDRLIRPSQDCSGGYGYSIWFNEITLKDDTYEEVPRARLQPTSVGAPIAGVHTYNRVGEWEVIDGRKPMQRRAMM